MRHDECSKPYYSVIIIIRLALQAGIAQNIESFFVVDRFVRRSQAVINLQEFECPSIHISQHQYSSNGRMDDVIVVPPM